MTPPLPRRKQQHCQQMSEAHRNMARVSTTGASKQTRSASVKDASPTKLRRHVYLGANLPKPITDEMREAGHLAPGIETALAAKDEARK